MPAKAPIYLKAAAPRRGKKQRLRDVLSGDMISPPLGDVRHSAHVGPEGEGDMFGDVRFLQGKMDMLPSPTHPPAPQDGHARSHSVQQRLDEEGGQGRDPQGYAAYNGLRYRHTPAGMLKTTISLPGFLAHEQAPPKPPRLHLDDPSPPFVPTPSQRSFFVPQLPTTTQPGDGQKPGGLLSLVENGGVGRLASEPYRDVSLSPAARLYVHPPASSSLGSGTSSSSEASSEDSASEGCGLLEPSKGLSLDSDAGLSNEDLCSERSESPWARCPAATAPTSSSTSASASSSSPPDTGVPRSDSMAVLDLDLGPSILDDVLGIMDRYKTLDNRWEL